MIYSIYAIVGDDNLNEYRYIGVASNLLQRYNEHLKEAHWSNKPLYRWIREEAKFKINLLTLDITNSRYDAHTIEAALINLYIHTGMELLNIKYSRNLSSRVNA